MIGLFCLTAAILSFGGLFGWNVGFVGLSMARFLRYTFGVGSWVAAAFLLGGGLHFLLRHKGVSFSRGFFSAFLLFASLLSIYHHVMIPAGAELWPDSLPLGGGFLGGGLLFFVRKFFGVTGSLILFAAVSVASLLVVTSWSLASGVSKTSRKAKEGLSAVREKVGQIYAPPVPSPLAPMEKLGADTLYDQEKDTRFSDVGVSDRTDTGATRDEKGAMRSCDMVKASVMDTLDHDEGRRLATAALFAKVREEKRAAEPSSLTSPELPAEEAMQSAGQDGETKTPKPLSKDTAAIDDMAAVFSFDSAQSPDAAVFPLPHGGGEESGTLPVEEAPQPSFPVLGSQAEEPSPAAALSVSEEPSPAASAPVSEEPSPAASAPVSEELPPAASLAVSEEAAADGYVLPRVEELLQRRDRVQNVQLTQEMAENSRILTQTLENFHVKATIVNACHGPAVTRYEVEPAPGVKVSKIANLADDLALALAAFSVRIEPVPGKSVIGIEVPNKKLDGVQLRDVLETEAFSAAPSKLTVGLGKDIGGQTILADLAKMPHLLVAGATGSGKSVCINTLITSILFKAKPEEVKFILIDPKMVELSGYNDIPHLMAPVVTDAQKAASVLNWSVREMENRYAKFAQTGVRDLRHYNEAVDAEEKMPAVVIIIDELADLMMVASHDVEDAICRLAQKARAAGLHLVLATQRPSVNVITGLIKANIPSRISFAVSSITDSRTILDRGGAEKLLGNGDMLFSPVGAAKPLRVQGAFISDEEIERLIEYIRAQGQQTVPNEDLIDFTEKAADESAATDTNAAPVDELLAPAVDLVLSAGQASTSSVQRRFRIGYTRAARLIDTMEELKIIGPNVGSKPREILMTKEQAAELLSSLG
ncbi:MAG: DNA translocase FtsK 4TM domain-containing protein [Schwartzia sp. (in: firmicutes)]